MRASLNYKKYEQNSINKLLVFIAIKPKPVRDAAEAGIVRCMLPASLCSVWLSCTASARPASHTRILIFFLFT